MLREYALAQRVENDRHVSLAWHVAALIKTKRLPRLRRLLSRRRRGTPTVEAPAVMTDERRARIAHLARGLTLADDIDPYKRPDDGGDDDA